MSDVNINTSWTITPGGDYEYNNVLGCAGYDPDDTRLFVSAQSPPNVAGNVRTEYARGFHMSADYNGDLVCNPADNTRAELKRVRFTMSFTGSSYDLTDARVYCQFQNQFNVNISSWRFIHVATEGTETTLASGSTISQGGQIQINFKNDYGPGQFYFEITYAVIPDPIVTELSGKWYKLPVDAYPTYVTGWYYQCSDTNTDMYIALVNNQTVFCTLESGKSIQLITPHETVYDEAYAFNYIPNLGYWGDFGFSSDNRPWIENSAAAYAGMTYADVANDFLSYIAGGFGRGVDTTVFNNYDGKVYTCRMFANIANVSPGPMATESEGGELGDFDITSDQITAPGIPSTYTQSYFGHIYLIDSGNLAAVSSIINSNDFIDQFYTNFGDIAKCIVSISQFPISTYSGAGTLGDIAVGSKRIASSSLTPQAHPLSRFAQVDCGSVDLHLFWDSALDLNPYTKLSVYIPCVGMRPLDADVVMGHTLGLYYNVDFMTGNALAILTLDGDYYDQYSCTLATQYALNTEQWGPVYQGIMSTLSTAAIGVAVSGSGGAMAGALAGAATQSVAQKLHHDKAGTMGASMSLFSQMQPFVEILRPIQQLPRDYTKFNAYPSYMTAQLINLSGYVEVQDIRLDDIDCTDAERTELLNMLQSGVIL